MFMVSEVTVTLEAEGNADDVRLFELASCKWFLAAVSITSVAAV